jgi:hypothetical protein
MDGGSPSVTATSQGWMVTIPQGWDADTQALGGRQRPETVHRQGSPPVHRPQAVRGHQTNPQHQETPMAYQDTIRHALDRLGQAAIDPRHVEASMRCVFGTLDHLGGAAWDRAVREAVAEVQAMGPEISEALAESWGL